MLRRRRRVTDRSSAGPPLAGDSERLAHLVGVARERLQPVLKLWESEKSSLAQLPGNLYLTLGGEHGVGILTRVARVPVTHGRVAENDLSRFLDEAALLREDFITLYNTYVIAFSLMLTICAVFAMGEASGFLDVTPPEDTMPDAWGPDAFTWLAPSNAPQVRRAFYAVEYTLLSLVMICDLMGLIHSVVMLAMLTALPSYLALLEFIIGDFSNVMFAYMTCDGVLIIFPLVLPLCLDA